MTREQREWLRAIRDQLVRERLVIPDASTPRCRGCRCWLHERTPGCDRCKYRHAARRRRNRRLFAEGRVPSEAKTRSGQARWQPA